MDVKSPTPPTNPAGGLVRPREQGTCPAPAPSTAILILRRAPRRVAAVAPAAGTVVPAKRASILPAPDPPTPNPLGNPPAGGP